FHRHQKKSALSRANRSPLHSQNFWSDRSTTIERFAAAGPPHGAFARPASATTEVARKVSTDSGSRIPRHGGPSAEGEWRQRSAPDRDRQRPTRNGRHSWAEAAPTEDFECLR